jgi:hypothetical protein
MSSDGSPATLIGTAFIIAIFSVMTPTVSTAQPQPVIVPIPLLPVPVNPCTGEPIVVNGESRFVTYGHSDSSGGFHALVRIIAKGKGDTVVAPAVAPGAITPAGAKYVMNTEYVEEAYLPPPGGFRELTVITNQVWVRQGEDPNAVLPTATDDDFRVKVTIHMTWNANGLPTAEVSQERATCPSAAAP